MYRKTSEEISISHRGQRVSLHDMFLNMGKIGHCYEKTSLHQRMSSHWLAILLCTQATRWVDCVVNRFARPTIISVVTVKPAIDRSLS